MGGLDAGDYAYLYDANGNVGQMVSWADIPDWQSLNLSSAQDWHASRLAARYEYDPYGRTVGPDTSGDGKFNESQDNPGPYAATNPFRFSTKYFDTETRLGNWGYRYYSPTLGRWVSRDPMGEAGGVSLYMYTHNAPSVRVDPVGLQSMRADSQPDGSPALLVGGGASKFGKSWDTGFLSNPSMSVKYSANMHAGGGSIAVEANADYFWPWYLKWPGWVVGVSVEGLTLYRHAKAEAKVDVRCRCVSGDECVISANLDDGMGTNEHGRLSVGVAFRVIYISETALQVIGEYAATVSPDDSITMKVGGRISTPTPGVDVGVGWEINLPESDAEFHKQSQWVYKCPSRQ